MDQSDGKGAYAGRGLVAVSEGLERPDRLARLREAAGEMEEALRDEGFDEQSSHGVFVRWQRQTV